IVGGSQPSVQEIFDVSLPGEMDGQIARAESLMVANNIASVHRYQVLDRFDEFKMVSTVNCQAIHLGEELTSDTRAIEDLVREFDRISAGIRGDGAYERSIEVFEANVPGKGKFQLRALVD